MRSQLFRLEGTILGKARPRVTRNGTHKPPRYSQCLKKLAHQASRQRRFTSAQHTPVRVEATIYVKRVGNRPAWCPKEAWDTERPVLVPVGGKGRADIDNAIGTILDAFNAARIWHDDCQVAELYVKQVMAGPRGGPGAVVLVTEVGVGVDG